MCDLKSKFDEWGNWLVGDDAHSIRNQIHNMVWDYAVFVCINEARKHSPLDKKGETELNPTVHYFIDRCFFQTQLLAIRRFIDRDTSEGDRSVYSLYRLIDDMENNCELLTRENILAAHDYPYDYEKETSRLYETELKKNPKPNQAQILKRYIQSKNAHQNIDSLLGIDATQRKLGDMIPKSIFEWLKHKLDDFKEIYDYVNKFLAHSASENSRKSIKADDIEITLGKIFNAHKTICEIAEFIAITLLYRTCGNFLATPQFDQFEHFEKPWATKEVVTKLYEFWTEYDRKTREWMQWNWQDEFKKHV